MLFKLDRKYLTKPVSSCLIISNNCDSNAWVCFRIFTDSLKSNNCDSNAWVCFRIFTDSLKLWIIQ